MFRYCGVSTWSITPTSILDSSTALRFHFGEEMLSVPWRAAQVALIGLTPLTFSIWQGAFLVMILFHHSEVELPLEWERR